MSCTCLVGIQTALSVWQKRLSVLMYSSTLCGLLPSTLLMWSPCGCVVRWRDLSRSLRTCLPSPLLQRSGRCPGGRAPPSPSPSPSPLVGSPLLRSHARTTEGEKAFRTARHQLRKLKATLRPDLCNAPTPDARPPRRCRRRLLKISAVTPSVC